MKSLKTLGYGIVLFALPQVSAAQWSLVRFDEMNYFTCMETVTPVTALSTGLLSQGNASFLMRTNDGGVTWDSLPIQVNGAAYMVARLNFTDVNNGYVGGLLGGMQALVKTTDNGNSWTDVTPDPSSPFPVTGISFLTPASGCISDDIYVYKTTDGGNNWTLYNPGIGIHDIGMASMNTGYVCGSDGQFAVVMKTTDGGNTWTQILSATHPFFSPSSMQKLDVLNADELIVSGQYSNLLYKSTDGGQSWDTISITSVIEIMDFDFTTNLEGHVVSSMGEIFATSDGGATWTLEYAVAAGAYGPSVLLTSLSFTGSTGYVCGTNGLIKKHDDSVTGVVNLDTGTSIRIYPNPINKHSLLTIEAPFDIREVELYNVAGELIQRFSGPASWNVSSLSPGMYNLKISGNGHLVYRRFIISD